jgi:GDP-4-dehydro-6-deoxy-D-mannose reductase
VNAYEQLMDRAPSGRPYNVCSGRAVRMGDVLDELIRQSTTRVELVRDQERFRPNDTPLLVGSAARIRDEIGWTPHYPLNETLRDTLDYWREQIDGSFA